MFIDPIKEAVAAALFEKDYEEPWSEATIIARRQWLDMADCAIRAMERTDIYELFCQMTNLLEGYMPILEKAAVEETISQENQTFKKVTQRNRLTAARECVNRGREIIWGAK